MDELESQQNSEKQVQTLKIGTGLPGPGRKKMTKEEKMLRKAIRDKAQETLEKLSLPAVHTLGNLLGNRDSKIQLGSANSILDRVGIGIKNPGVAVQINFDQIRNQYDE